MYPETRAFAARRERHENAAARARRTPSAQKAKAAPMPDFTDPLTPLATAPSGYTLEMERADRERGLRNTRQLVLGAIESATVYAPEAEVTMWKALREIDAALATLGVTR